MKRVFLSHSTRDRAVAQQVCRFLESQQLPCWIAPRDIVAGDDWDESIVRAIHDSATVVLILSEYANRSPEVKREVGIASNRRLPVVPFRIEDVELSASLEWFISRTHWLDAFPPPLEQYFDALADTLVRLRKRPAENLDREFEKATAAATDVPPSTPLVESGQAASPPPSWLPQNLSGAVRMAPCANGRVRYRRTADQAVMRVFHRQDFTMGAADGDLDERPEHPVRLTPFLLDESPVSAQQFAVFLTLWGSDRDDEGHLLADAELAGLERNGLSWQCYGDGRESVVGVTWYGAQAYASWVGMHLPSEAQFERTAALLLHSPDKSLAEDLHLIGLIRHWCADTYDESYYKHSPVTNPLQHQPGLFAVVRGASPFACLPRATLRQFHGRSELFLDLGFRCALTIPEELLR